MRNRYSLVFEILWIITGIVCVSGGIRSVILEEGNRFIIFFIMAAVAFGFAWVRHSQRR